MFNKFNQSITRLKIALSITLYAIKCITLNITLLYAIYFQCYNLYFKIKCFSKMNRLLTLKKKKVCAESKEATVAFNAIGALKKKVW